MRALGRGSRVPRAELVPKGPLGSPWTLPRVTGASRPGPPPARRPLPEPRGLPWRERNPPFRDPVAPTPPVGGPFRRSWSGRDAGPGRGSERGSGAVEDPPDAVDVARRERLPCGSRAWAPPHPATTDGKNLTFGRHGGPAASTAPSGPTRPRPSPPLLPWPSRPGDPGVDRRVEDGSSWVDQESCTRDVPSDPLGPVRRQRRKPSRNGRDPPVPTKPNLRSRTVHHPRPYGATRPDPTAQTSAPWDRPEWEADQIHYMYIW